MSDNDPNETRQQRSRNRRRALGLLPLQTVWHRRARFEALSYYSGGEPRCECCNEHRVEFLAIDHIDGKGHIHRDELKKSGSNIYHFLRRNQFPDGYRVLCHNCNQSLGLYRYCPHQTGTKTSEWMESITEPQKLDRIVYRRMLTIDGSTKSVDEWETVTLPTTEVGGFSAGSRVHLVIPHRATCMVSA
jgi:hypothetical protein